ncbi:MAG: hypothetical protein A2Y38_04715 [Spirochaetes bacterium GWB1_59_5]|nr:MAG: hypothetical protein A2Y38_04715 [Spirochaetes bacterium GWB1_59_5]
MRHTGKSAALQAKKKQKIPDMARLDKPVLLMYSPLEAPRVALAKVDGIGSHVCIQFLKVFDQRIYLKYTSNIWY